MNKKIIVSFLLVLSAGTAQAVTAFTTFPVTALVLTSCAVSATPLAFANYNPAASRYGRLFAGQNVSAGAYSDTVTVTVNY